MFYTTALTSGGAITVSRLEMQIQIGMEKCVYVLIGFGLGKRKGCVWESSIKTMSLHLHIKNF